MAENQYVMCPFGKRNTKDNWFRHLWSRLYEWTRWYNTLYHYLLSCRYTNNRADKSLVFWLILLFPNRQIALLTRPDKQPAAKAHTHFPWSGNSPRLTSKFSCWGVTWSWGAGVDCWAGVCGGINKGGVVQAALFSTISFSGLSLPRSSSVSEILPSLQSTVTQRHKTRITRILLLRFSVKLSNFGFAARDTAPKVNSCDTQIRFKKLISSTKGKLHNSHPAVVLTDILWLLGSAAFVHAEAACTSSKKRQRPRGR